MWPFLLFNRNVWSFYDIFRVIEEKSGFSESLPGSRFQGQPLSGVVPAENGLSKNRIGISVSKKVGNSVVRHHMCRLIRESYRLNEKSLKPGYDLVVVVRPLAKGRSYREIESALLHLMKLQNLVQELSSENKDEKNLNRND